MLTSNYRNILLWRHADALPLSDDVPVDIDRPLSKKGHNQAQKIANWLTNHLPKNTLMIASTALRSKQTVQAFSDDFIVYDTLAPGASLETVLKTINDLSTNHQGRLDLLIIGHQPWLGELAAQLLDLNQSEMNIKKGSLWWFKASKSVADPTYNLFCVQTPRLL